MLVNSIKNVYNNNNYLIKKSTQFTNLDAEKLLKKELINSMPEKRIDYYIARLKGICEKLKIQFKNLPLNKEHPGNLTPEQDKELCREILKVDVVA